MNDERPLPGPARSRALALVVLAYSGVAALGFAIGALRHQPNVFVCASLRLGSGDAKQDALFGAGASLAGGVVLAVVIIAATRWLVRTQSWAAALHEDLRPFVRALGPEAIVPLALASSIGEEILFRGALVPAIGIFASSLVFGALHQLRGRSRLSWVAFATVVGLLLGGLFEATGSLLGPIVAHALINGVNLRFLLTHAPPRRSPLGGLLRR